MPYCMYTVRHVGPDGNLFMVSLLFPPTGMYKYFIVCYDTIWYRNEGVDLDLY